MAVSDRDYDTDVNSITSTVSSTKTAIYDVQAVLSERPVKLADGRETTEYLLQWDGYPMHRSTWEPPENLEGTDLLRLWAQRRRRMGEVKFKEFMAKNEAEFELAIEKFDLAKSRRKAKREKMRQQLRGQIKPIDTPAESDSEESVPLRLQKRTSQRQTVSAEVALATREAEDSSELNSLFVDDPIVRKPPLQQSESSLSEHPEDNTDASDDSLMEDVRETAKKAKRKVADEDLLRGERQIPRKIIQPSENSMKTTAVVRKPKTPTKQSDAVAKATAQPRRPPQNPAVPVTRDRGGLSTTQKDGVVVDKNRRPVKSAAHTSSSTQQGASNVTGNTTSVASAATANTTNTNSTVTNQPATSTAPTNDLSTVPGAQTSSGIKIVNQPKTHPRQWQNGNNVFKTLHGRRIAEIRSRTESTPDPGALEIVNDPSGTIKARTQTPKDEPYGRRETATRRVQENDADDTPRRGSVDAVTPLESWEADKIPLVCPYWRYSNSCRYGPQKCRFLHRNQDALGRDYPVGDENGWLPPKYRTPPITCPFWLTDKAGCKKTEAACKFAHRNTGWLGTPKRGEEPSRIDPTMIPVSEETMRLPSKPGIGSKAKKHMSRANLTCWFWTKGECQNTAEKCPFQHYDTGITADPPPSAITCKRWVEGTCERREEECKYQHWNTGVIEGQIGNEPRSALTQPVSDFPTDHFGRTPLPKPDAAAITELDDEMWYPPQAPISQPPPPPPLPPPTEQPPAKITCLQLKLKIEQAFKLDFTDMFISNDAEKGSAVLHRRAFLIYYPEQHSEELDLITRWLLMHHVEVSNAWYEGSWDNFKQQVVTGGSGIIITHPDFEYFTELPGFGQVLRKQVRIWSVGLQEAIEYDPALSDCSPELRYDRIETFPLGGFIYITDDVFEKKPRLALKIVQLFFAKIKKLRQLAGPISPWHEVGDVCLLWRFCVRPELMEYLFQHCEAHAKELEAGDPDVQSCAKLYKILKETNYIEQDDPSVPPSPVPDKFPILSERRTFAEEQPVDYFNTLAQSQEEANLHMIQYYAGLQVDMRRDYRHFYVVHTEPSAPCAQQWKQEIQTIAEVITPENCIEELGKVGSVSMFDFCERSMPESTTKMAQKTAA